MNLRIPSRVLAALCGAPLLANHGPGTSGGGSSTISGETLRAGGFDLSLRTDFTQFENITRAEAANRAIQSDEFDGVDRTLVESLSIAYGLTDDVQLGAQIGYYSGDNFVAAEADGMGGATVATADPRGLTDLWLTSKFRLAHGPAGHFAAIAGVKLPTGKDDERLSNGEKLEPSSQPGSGAVDYLVGVAWSKYLSARTTIDVSGTYTYRGEHDDFRVGDRWDGGVAVAYRLTEDVKSFPNWSVSGELLGVYIDEDEDGGVKNWNSGGTTIYLAPGIRERATPHLAWALAPAFPIVQDLHGDQIETTAKLTFSLSFSL
jgi:hypothetical protein